MWTTAKPFLREASVHLYPYDPRFGDLKVPAAPYPLDPSCPSGRAADSQVAVYVFTEEASALEEAAWLDLTARPDLWEAALLRKLRAVHERDVAQFLEEELPGLPGSQKPWEALEARLGRSPSEVPEAFFKLVGICLDRTGMEGSAFVGFEFQSGWDPDHGLEIVMHQGRVLAAAGMTELIGGDGSVLDGVKSIQEYEFDPGDWMVP